MPENAEAPTMAEWLRRQKQPEECVRYFWALVLESALGDTLAHVSAAAAQRSSSTAFSPREAYEVIVARAPLGELWQRVGTWLTRHGAKLHMRSRIERLDLECGTSQNTAGETPAPQIGLVMAEGLYRMFDHVVAAVSWKQLGGLLGPEVLRRIPRAETGAALQSSPITAVHLWFDRPMMELPHAAIVGRLSQWVFNNHLPSPTGRGAGSEGGLRTGESKSGPSAATSPHPGLLPEGEGKSFHYTVVISASHALAGRGTKEVLDEVLGELRSIWPATAEAQLVHHRVLTQPGAVFSVRPGIEAMRPGQQTPFPGLYLAGDLDCDRLARHDGRCRAKRLPGDRGPRSATRPPRAVLVPDLKRSWLTRWLVGTPLPVADLPPFPVADHRENA